MVIFDLELLKPLVLIELQHGEPSCLFLNWLNSIAVLMRQPRQRIDFNHSSSIEIETEKEEIN